MYWYQNEIPLGGSRALYWEIAPQMATLPKVFICPRTDSKKSPPT